MKGDRGSASIWVLATGVLVLFAGYVAATRTEAVVARHRAEAAADLAALAAAGRIGVAPQPCAAARAVAAANGAALASCAIALAADGRSGTVRVQVRASASFPLIGVRTVVASARAGRLPVAAGPPARLPTAPPTRAR